MEEQTRKFNQRQQCTYIFIGNEKLGTFFH